MTNVVVDPEFRALIPSLTQEEFVKLENNLLADGCRDALVVWKQGHILLDGHNRLDICKRHGVKYRTVEIDLHDRVVARVWIRNNQLSRRNLTKAWYIELGLGNKEDLAAIGRKKRAATLKQNASDPVLSQNDKTDSKPKHDTRAEIAKRAGVSTGQVGQAEVVRRESPKLWEKAKAGEETIGGAYRQVRQKIKEEVREKRRQENATKASAVNVEKDLTGMFSTIVLDPPWSLDDEGDVNQLGRAKQDYASMSIEELLALPVGRYADADCHLYLWITNRSLPKGFRLLESWGFRHVTMLTWPKPSFGMGNYFRGQTEHVLFGVKGSQQLRRKNASTLLPSWSRGPGGHSSKPVEFREFVESCSPGPFLEMFSRGTAKKGWTLHGEDGVIFEPSL